MVRLNGVRHLIVVGLLLGLVFSAPASAQTSEESDVEISARVGLGGQVRLGQPFVVEVVLESDRLVTGTLRVDSRADGDRREIPVELPAGTRREVAVTMAGPEFDFGQDAIIVRFSADDGSGVDVRPTIRVAPVGPIAVVGPLAAGAPNGVVLATSGVSVNLVEVDVSELVAPGRLGPASIVVTEQATLDRLGPGELAQVMDWVLTGGQLVVDDATSTVGVLPAAWHPGPAGRARVGSGMVIGSGNMIAGGGWDQLDAAPIVMLPDGLGMGTYGFERAAQSASRDAGLASASASGPLAAVVIYTIVIGPLSYLVLRRRRRTGLLWISVPIAAVVVAAGIVVTGTGAQTSARFAHVAVIDTAPGAAHVFATVGGTKPAGGSLRLDVPSGTFASLGDRFGSGQGGRSTVRGTGEAATLLFDVPAGGFGSGRIIGPADLPDTELTVESRVEGDDVIVEVTNNTPWRLDEVAVFGGSSRSILVGSLESRASASETLVARPVSGDFFAPRESEVWPRAIGWGSAPDVKSVVAFSVFSEYQVARGPSAYPPGLVTAVGWTREAEVPAGSGVGRTAVVGRSVMSAAGYAPIATQIDVVDIGAFDWDGGEPIVPTVVRVIPNVVPDGPIVIGLARKPESVEVRRGDAWVPLDTVTVRGASATEFPETVAVEPGDCPAGVCYLRVNVMSSMLDFGFRSEGRQS